MRISVLGNSDTTGMMLATSELTWPQLIIPRLAEELSEDVQVDSWRFAPYRANAVSYAMGLVDDAQPDVVLITLASYWCAFTTVRGNLERRFGKRAGRVYNRVERAFTGTMEASGPGLNTRRKLSRHLARTVGGARPMLTVRQFNDIFSAVIRELSIRENLQVLVMGDHHFTANVRSQMPAIEPAIAKIEQVIRPLVEERRLEWDDIEAAVQIGGRRDEMIQADGVHMTPEAHERVANMLVPRIAAMRRALS